MGNGAATLKTSSIFEKRIVVIGLQGSGKTSLIHSLRQLQEGSLTLQPIFPPSTRQPQKATLRLNQEKYTIIDGLSIEKIHVEVVASIYVVDSTDSIRLPHVAQELQALRAALQPHSRIFIVATKMDLPQAENPEKELHEFLPAISRPREDDFVALSVFKLSDMTALYKKLCSL